MPAWVEQGVNEYTKRLKDYIKFNLIEIPLIKRAKTSDLKRILEKEALLINASIPDGARVIALTIDGETFSSEKLATKFEALQQMVSHVCFIIGGPEGLSELTLSQCQERWSLSALTLPHPLVRVVLIEAIYRAWSIIHNHPYHK
ncbi:rRNA large subunit methyltransferase [Legionella beliardensis]|uniref:Ribosomal RNA large subunit methyltransferase H n=2 Tax=Legionella beliardensis TaxID=91822 RepID=A0A378I2M8_9GAMM|nr:rRNA large subunit methyltransferase [Legionella beliardensis]